MYGEALKTVGFQDEKTPSQQQLKTQNFLVKEQNDF
jgi:hypothetical protein